jgi:hypothetical protein
MQTLQKSKQYYKNGTEVRKIIPVKKSNRLMFLFFSPGRPVQKQKQIRKRYVSVKCTCIYKAKNKSKKFYYEQHAINDTVVRRLSV